MADDAKATKKKVPTLDQIKGAKKALDEKPVPTSGRMAEGTEEQKAELGKSPEELREVFGMEPGDMERNVKYEAPTLAEELTKLTAAGLSEEEALQIVSQRRGVSGEAAPAHQSHRATPGDGELLGADPTLVAEYKKRMETYVAPVTDQTLCPEGFVLPIQFADYVTRLSHFETARRRRHSNPVSVEEMVMIIVKQHWHWNTVDRTLLMNPNAATAATGPAAAFKPEAGTFSG